jgi:hypothetical protein
MPSFVQGRYGRDIMYPRRATLPALHARDPFPVSFLSDAHLFERRDIMYPRRATLPAPRARGPFPVSFFSDARFFVPDLFPFHPHGLALISCLPLACFP